ncbi:VWA domain-containing protein [Roseivirga sp.]|uniref:VWA domain-containing protein n=1 Tax=Roseivirga sp. TaxID=1964215 RepID=UPI003B8D622A
MQQSKLYFFLLMVSALFTMSCNSDDSENLNLAVTIEDQFVNLPSNVSVFFRVEDAAGNGVAGLTENDFVIYENGAIISEFEATRKIQPNEQVFDYHITLMLDLSGSVLGSENLEALKTASKSFIDEVVPSDDKTNAQAIKMDIWWFDGSENIKQLQAVSTSATELKASIDNISPAMSSDNSTNLFGAVIQGIEVATQKLTQTRNLDEIASSAVVIFTDGTDQANRNTKGQALSAVSNADRDLSIYTIGLGGEIDEQVLREIGKTSFVSAANIGELLDSFREIGDLINGRANSYYLLEYCSPKRSGNNQLTIEVNKGALVGKANSLFDASDFNGSCTLE